jgi:outer membrane protein TolC
MVVSVSQPLLKGAGYDYNTTALKIAKLDAKMGVSEFMRQLEAYLLEISRTYWGVYLARAGYLQKVHLVDQTQEIVSQLEERAKVDEKATASELMRARSALAERRARLIRSEMAIRIAEERLRALVNDPSFHLGSNVEVIPQTRPILAPPVEDVREVAELAIANRPELLEGIYQVQAAGLRRDLSKNELMPTLDLILESTVAGIEEGRDVGKAWTNQFDRGGPGWLVGVKFEMPWERNFAKAQDTRRKHELRQQVNQLRSTLDSVMLEAVVAYQELRTSYRDMQGKYQAVLASREEMAELEARLDVEAGEEGKSVGYQLQLMLDAIERNEQAEEAFLVSVVVYNTAFTTLDRARGTLLRKHGVTFDRSVGQDGLDKIDSSVGGMEMDVE